MLPVAERRAILRRTGEWLGERARPARCVA